MEEVPEDLYEAIFRIRGNFFTKFPYKIFDIILPEIIG